MARTPLTAKETVAFKIGARARKFVLEGCPVEGYEILMTALAETKESDHDLHSLLTVEMEKFEKRMAAMLESSED